jgi:NAD+ kinase
VKRSVLIVGDRRRPGVADGVERHRSFLASRMHVLDADLEERVDLSRAQADLVLVFGGDGSILHVARRLERNPLPVLGVNYGKFGFLADLEPHELEEGIERWLRGEGVSSERVRLDVTLERDGREAGRMLALNDVVVGREDVGRMVDVDVAIDGARAVSYSGDGLIVATATGSTAHALAAGGPFIEPTVNAMVLVPLACHALSTRPLVIPGAQCVDLSVGATRAAGAVTVDGSPPWPIAEGDRVRIRDAHAPLTLLHVSGRSFYDALRTKLGWRGGPEYAQERAPPRAAPR